MERSLIIWAQLIISIKNSEAHFLHKTRATASPHYYLAKAPYTTLNHITNLTTKLAIDFTRFALKTEK